VAALRALSGGLGTRPSAPPTAKRRRKRERGRRKGKKLIFAGDAKDAGMQKYFVTTKNVLKLYIMWLYLLYCK